MAGVDHDLHLIAERVQRLTGAQGAARLAAALAAARAAAAAAFSAQLRQEQEEGEAGGSMSAGTAGSQSRCGVQLWCKLCLFALYLQASVAGVPVSTACLTCVDSPSPHMCLPICALQLPRPLPGQEGAPQPGAVQLPEHRRYRCGWRNGGWVRAARVRQAACACAFAWLCKRQ